MFNNDFIRNALPSEAAGTGRTNIRISTGTSNQVKNNIFYKGRPSESDHQQAYIYSSSSGNSLFDYNTYYWPGYQSRTYWLDSNYDSVSVPGQEAYGFDGDPGLIDLEGNDFRVASSGSQVVDSGTAMGTGDIAILNIHGTDYHVRWDAALDPSTDWSTTPPNVIPANQGDHGTWERGAYVYTGGVTQTCSSLGYYCCPSGSTCSAPRTGSGCSGTCCASVSQCTVNPGCGDSTCGAGECDTCFQDCSFSQCCPDTKCNNGETCSTCSDDCSCPAGLCDGLSALWHLDSDASDSSGNANDGTLYGPSQTSGQFSGAYSFDGSADYIRVVDPGSGSPLDLPGDFTVSAWAHFSSLTFTDDWENVHSSFPRIVQKGGDLGSAGSWALVVDTYSPLGFACDDRNVLTFGSYSGSAQSFLCGSTELLPGQWYHLAAVRSGTSLTLYMDGEQEATGPIPSASIDSNNDPLYIGEDLANPDGAMDGIIDEVTIWSRALSASEVQSLHEQGSLACGQVQDTCQTSGGQCCSACSPGTERPGYDDDCPGVCCGSCEPIGNYLPDQYIEAEAGTLTSPMQTGSDSLASGGQYIFTTARDEGSADYTFDIASPGDYIIEARIIAPTTADDSYYVGLDGEQLQGDDYYSWDTIAATSWAWTNVTRRGSGTVEENEFNPMVWTLSAGTHTFTFFGRDTNTLLDQFILRKLSHPIHRADTNGDGCVDSMELDSFINLWYLDSTEYTMGELMEAVGLWKAGTGCPGS